MARVDEVVYLPQDTTFSIYFDGFASTGRHFLFRRSDVEMGEKIIRTASP